MKIAIVFLVLVLSTGVFAQNESSYLVLDTGVQRHAGIDEIYKRFSKAYKDLDHTPFTSLYAEDAAYLVPGNNIDIGNTGITDGFKLFFDSVRSKGETLSISFQIVQRKISGEMGYDVGIYTLRNHKAGKQLGEVRGKFVVVAVKYGKEWKFQVDGYSEMPK